MVFPLSFQRRLNFDSQEIRVLQSEADRVDAPDDVARVLDLAQGEINSSRSLITTNRPDEAFRMARSAERHYVQAQAMIYRSQQRNFNVYSTAARVDYWASQALIVGGFLGMGAPVLAGAYAAGPGLAFSAYVQDEFEVMREGVSEMTLTRLQNPLNDEANLAILNANPNGSPARFGDYFIRRELDDLSRRAQVRNSLSQEERTEFISHWEAVRNEVRNYRPDQHLNDEEQLVAVSQLIYYSAHLGPYHKGQTQLLGWQKGDGGNCVLRSKVFASLLAESSALKPPWQVTVRYYDGDANNDGHQEVILYNPDTGHMINPMTGEIFTESDSPLFDSTCLYAEDLMAHGQDPIHEFESFRRYTPRNWNPSQLNVEGHQPIQTGRMSRMRVGVVGTGGRAPDRAYTPPPRLHYTETRSTNPQVVDDLPDGMSTEKVNVLLGQPLLFHPTEDNYYTQTRFEMGIPFVMNLDTHQVEFASYPFYQRFRRMRSGQQRFDYLRRLSTRFLAENGDAQRQARFILQDPANIVLYTPAQIFAAAIYLNNVQIFRTGLGSSWRDDFAGEDLNACRNLMQRNTVDQIIGRIDRLPLYARSQAFSFFAQANQIQAFESLGDDTNASFLSAILLRVNRQEGETSHISRPVSRHHVLLAQFNPDNRGLTGVFSRQVEGGAGGLGNESRLSDDTIFAILSRASVGLGALSNPFTALSQDEQRTWTRLLRRMIGGNPDQRVGGVSSPETINLMIRLSRLRAFTEEEADFAERQVREVFATHNGSRILNEYIEPNFNVYLLVRSESN